MIEKDKCGNYATVKELAKIYESYSEASIRNLIFNHKKYKFTRCIIKQSSKILIDINEFERWLTNQRMKEE